MKSILLARNLSGHMYQDPEKNAYSLKKYLFIVVVRAYSVVKFQLYIIIFFFEED